MRISYHWLQDYIDAPLPQPNEIARVLTMHAFEVESVEQEENDWIFEIAVLPNRSHDCLSYIGIAREVATLCKLPFKLPDYTCAGHAAVSTNEAVTLVVPDTMLVRRALKRLVIDVEVGESPEWLKKKLAAHGQRSINNIVDVTNFVMWETGQPVHAFDYDKIAGVAAKEISIRSAQEGETVTTLDGKTFELDSTMLVIADREKALDIAGVKGGAVSGIDSSTKRVLLSACTFHPTVIRKTSRKLGLMTDASKRFEQELSPMLAERAMHRLSQLIAELAHGTVAADIVESYPKVRHPYFAGVAVSEANTLLGTDLAGSDIEDIFTRLGFTWRKINPREEVLAVANGLLGVPYKFGASISYDAPDAFDCSSLIAFAFARAGFALPRRSVDQYVFGEPVAADALKPGDLIFSNSDTGKIEYASVEYMPGTPVPEGVDHVGLYIGDGKVLHASRKNEHGVEIQELATSPSFTKITGYRRIITTNEDRYVVTVPPERLDLHAGPGFMISGTSADLIEEIGRVYGYENIIPSVLPEVPTPVLNKAFYYTSKIRDILTDLGFSEVMTYAFQSEGDVAVANPLAEDKTYLRASLEQGLRKAFDLNDRNKALLGGAVQLFEIGTVFKRGEEHLELGVVAQDGKIVDAAFEAIGAALGHTLQQERGLADLTTYIETLPEPGTLRELADIESDIRFKPLSIYPFMLRDIAVWVPDAQQNDILDVVRSEAGDLFVRGDLFDSFAKDGRTSYAYHLVFQSHEKTLSDDEVNAIMERITVMLNSREGWKVR